MCGGVPRWVRGYQLTQSIASDAKCIWTEVSNLHLSCSDSTNSSALVFSTPCRALPLCACVPRHAAQL